MPLSEFFSISFVDLIGIVISIIGFYFVIRQLYQSRLAAQMSAFLSLLGQYRDNMDEFDIIDNLATSAEWNNFDNAAAFNYLKDNEDYWLAYKHIATFYETTALMVDARALDKKLARDGMGSLGKKRYDILEKAIRHHRASSGIDDLYILWAKWVEIYRITSLLWGKLTIAPKK